MARWVPGGAVITRWLDVHVFLLSARLLPGGRGYCYNGYIDIRNGAGGRNRTRMTSLQCWRSAVELPRHFRRALTPLTSAARRPWGMRKTHAAPAYSGIRRRCPACKYPTCRVVGREGFAPSAEMCTTPPYSAAPCCRSLPAVRGCLAPIARPSFRVQAAFRAAADCDYC